MTCTCHLRAQPCLIKTLQITPNQQQTHTLLVISFSETITAATGVSLQF